MDRMDGYSVGLEGLFLKEFIVRGARAPAEINRRLLERGIIGGLDVAEQVENGMLVCVTEMNTREEIERLAEGLREAGRGGLLPHAPARARKPGVPAPSRRFAPARRGRAGEIWPPPTGPG